MSVRVFAAAASPAFLRWSPQAAPASATRPDWLRHLEHDFFRRLLRALQQEQPADRGDPARN
jgi:hypothetical protein